MTLYCKLIQSTDFSILLCADKDIIGKTLSENGLEVEIKKEAYVGKKTSKKELAELLKNTGNVNLFGQKCVQAAIEAGFASEKMVKKIQGVPHLQIYHLR